MYEKAQALEQINNFEKEDWGGRITLFDIKGITIQLTIKIVWY